MQYTEIFLEAKKIKFIGEKCFFSFFSFSFFFIFIYLFFFNIFALNIDCGYTLELTKQGGSNDYPQSMFLTQNKKNTPAQPSFAI